ncbi:hypothetical protein SETIT_3G269300v2 [Setaria italica]|uniref:Uncharacterized protein n=1 Tax=Setaria italica TaxID=4555 RepID=K3ZD15_SETIT|nr:hypothetical protein SETIT_3G269300v2 [Setaria italica]
MPSSIVLAMPIVQWCELPTKICGGIISRIDVLDVMSFSSTCKSLQLVCKTLRATVLKSGNGWGIEDDLKTGKFGLHDVSNALSFCCVNEVLQHRIWLGGKGDWLVTTNTSLDLELLNTITRTKVPLPSFGNNLSGIELPSYRELTVIFSPFSHDVRRVVLSQMPSHADGYEAITLFSNGLLTHTAQEVFLDVIVNHGLVIAVEEDGDIFASDMSGMDLTPVQLPMPKTTPSEEELERVLYLAISPSNQLILACLSGHDFGHNNKASRMVWNEHDRFEQLADSISMFEFDDADVTWRRISSIRKDRSLFLGLNYPFFVTSTDLKGNSIYVAYVRNFAVGICSLDTEGQVSITNQGFLVDEKACLLQGWTIRTPMWFGPSTHARKQLVYIYSIDFLVTLLVLHSIVMLDD